MKILMVCLGNICRSPLAEGIMQQMASKAGLSWVVESAGTNSYHIGEPPHHLSQKVAKAHGLDIGKQRARRFKSTDLEEYDKIFAMSSDVIYDMQSIAGNKYKDEKVSLLLDELYPEKHMDVPDPWYGPEEGYHRAYKIIEEACNSIIKKYSTLNIQQSILK